MAPDDNRIIDVGFDEQNLQLRLTDGRVLPLRLIAECG
jgi:hypothetical protein